MSNVVNMRREQALLEDKRLVNQKEMVMEVLTTLDRQDYQFARNLMGNVQVANSEGEVRMVMDGLLVLAGFFLRDN